MRQYGVEFQLNIPQKMTADKFRTIAHKANTDNLPARLFWKNEDGQPLLDTTAIRWVKTRQGVAIIGPKEEASLIEDNAFAIAKGVKHSIGSVSINEVDRPISVTAQDDNSPELFRLPLFSLSNKQKLQQWLYECPQPERHEFVKDKIYQYFMAEADFWGVEDDPIETAKELIHITSLSYVRGSDIRSKNNTSPRHRVLFVDFLMPVKLQGIWSLGRLKNRGVGQVMTKVRP